MSTPRTGLGEVRTSRRIVFSGLGALGVAAALAGCSGGDDDSGGEPTVAAGEELVKTSEVPVGGGVILTDRKVVVTQPTAGEFKAFTALCTHQQLMVTSVKGGEIMCANHGSVYSAESGEVQRGPAPTPLAAVEITVDGDRILAA